MTNWRSESAKRQLEVCRGNMKMYVREAKAAKAVGNAAKYWMSMANARHYANEMKYFEYLLSNKRLDSMSYDELRLFCHRRA